MCGYRDIKNFDRFNLIVQSIICLTVTKLKKIKELLDDLAVSTKIVNDSIAATASNCEKPAENLVKDESTNSKDGNEDESKKEPVEKVVAKVENVEPSVITTTEPKPTPPVPVKLNDDETYDKWALPEIEKLLIFISKVFLLNFPLYVAYKHGVHARLDEISPQEAQSLSLFCDLHDNEMPAFLLRNVSIFCNSGGFPAMMECFDQPNLPVSTAHAITAAISNLKLWLNYRSIIQQFVPLRIKVLQYMCKLSDQDLRSASTKSMAGMLY
jgi:ubiquitin carboxyl-terminal hydrolase 34